MQFISVRYYYKLYSLTVPPPSVPYLGPHKEVLHETDEEHRPMDGDWVILGLDGNRFLWPSRFMAGGALGGVVAEDGSVYLPPTRHSCWRHHRLRGSRHSKIPLGKPEARSTLCEETQKQQENTHAILLLLEIDKGVPEALRPAVVQVGELVVDALNDPS